MKMGDIGVTQTSSIMNYFQREKSPVATKTDTFTKDKKIVKSPILVDLKEDALGIAIGKKKTQNYGVQCHMILLVKRRVLTFNGLNKLSLVGTQLPEKYKENFDVLNECPYLELQGAFARTSKLFLYFTGSCIPTNKSLFILLDYLHWHRQWFNHLIQLSSHSIRWALN
jgi:hypothetical protein